MDPGSGATVKMECPVCKGSNTVFRFAIDSYRIIDCRSCSHIFTGLKLDHEKVMRIYSDDYFFGGKNGYPDYTIEKDMLISRGEMYAGLAEQFMAPGTLLDVGAAAGFFMKGFENKGWKVHGLEPNHSMAGYGRKNLGLDIKTSTLESAGNLTDVNPDLILMIQVVAHLFDLEKSMRVINQSLKKGGFIIVETWNSNSFTARLTGRHWHEYSPPSTLNYFNRKTFDLLMNRHGFKKIATGRPGKKLHSRHAKSLLRHKLQSRKSLKWLAGIEKVLPENKFLPYPAEDLFWALYRKLPGDQ